MTCPDCDGNGLAPGAYGVLAQGIAVSMGGVLLQCPTCKGRGTVCDKCGGRGSVRDLTRFPDGANVCRECGGSGEEQAT